MRNLVILILIAATVCLTACSPRELPGFKREAKRQDERITRETEEAIKKSPPLQELNRLCTEEIPRPDGFIAVDKYGNLIKGTYLGYGYHSEADYQSVKSFYMDYFSQHGWRLTRQKDDGWGPPEIEFRKDSYEVTISYLGTGAGANYSFDCKKLTASSQ